MARIDGVTRGGSLMTRAIFFYVRRVLGQVPRTLRILALRPPLLVGHARMEQGQQKARRVPERLKKLAQLRVATRVGCPF